jgi:3-hydroxyisobutyrate dehydrogenase
VKERIGWIGAGRMGYAMAERLAKTGGDVTIWNRTRAKAEPLAEHGAKIASKLSELAACDMVFCMVSTWDDVKEVVAGPGGLLSAGKAPRLFIECSSISLEGSAELRAILSKRDIQYLAAPVSGNAKPGVSPSYAPGQRARSTRHFPRSSSSRPPQATSGRVSSRAS